MTKTWTQYQHGTDRQTDISAMPARAQLAILMRC